MDFKAIAAKLDDLKSIGADALILPMPRLPAAPLQTPDAILDSFDDLIHQASTRGIRVLVNLSASGVTADLPATARFWLSRGVAGFRIVTPPETSPEVTQSVVEIVRQTTSSAVGERIVIADFNPDANSISYVPHRQSVRRRKGMHVDPDLNAASAQLQIDSRLKDLELPGADNVRPLLEQSLLQPNVLLDFHPPSPPSSPDPYPALANVMAAIVLTTHSAALVDADHDSAMQSMMQPISNAGAADSSEWHRQLTALRHSNATLRYGSVTVLNFDAQNALVWVTRPSRGSGRTPPVVVACNLSASPVQISLGAATRRLNLRGTFLRTLLRSDGAMGAHYLSLLNLPPFGVYIGELRR